MAKCVYNTQSLHKNYVRFSPVVKIDINFFLRELYSAQKKSYLVIENYELILQNFQ